MSQLRPDDAATRLPTLPQFAATALRDFREFARTIKPTLAALVFRPGRLSSDYVAGRGHDTHINPIRLFVLSATACFLASRLSRGLLFLFSLDAVAKGIGEQWAVWATAILALPAAAAVLKLMYWKRGLPFLAHLVFVTHVGCFFMLLSTVDSLIGFCAGDFTPDHWAYGASAAAIAVGYGIAGLRSFYRDPWWKAVLKGGLLVVAYLVVLASWLGGVVLG